MNTIALLVGMGMATVFIMLTFPFYDVAVQHDATCPIRMWVVLHLAVVGFVLSVVTSVFMILAVMQTRGIHGKQ